MQKHASDDMMSNKYFQFLIKYGWYNNIHVEQKVISTFIHVIYTNHK